MWGPETTGAYEPTMALSAAENAKAAGTRLPASASLPTGSSWAAIVEDAYPAGLLIRLPLASLSRTNRVAGTPAYAVLRPSP